MDLVEAFVSLQPLAPHLSPAEARAARDAARVLHGELVVMSRQQLPGRSFSDDDRDTVVSTVLYRMVKLGPRRGRPGDPTDLSGVRVWLVTAVRNAGRDILRQRRPTRSLDDDSSSSAASLAAEVSRAMADASGQADRGADGSSVAEQQDQAAREVNLERQAHTMLHAVVLPRAVRTKERAAPGAGERLQVTLIELQAAASAGRDVQEIAAAELAQDPAAAATPQALQKRRAAIDKRFQRAREAVLAEIDLMRKEDQINDAMVARLSLAVQEVLYLQRRRDSVLANHVRAAAVKRDRRLSGGFSVS